MIEEVKMKITEDFPEWKALERLRLNGFKPIKENKRLREIARKWLPYKIIDELGSSPDIGRYHWAFCVELEQERIWGYREFIEGKTHGKESENRDRDNNPYKERARNRSWDRGYILGMSERRIVR